MSKATPAKMAAIAKSLPRALDAWKAKADATKIDRFWSKVYMEPMSGCWLWLGSLNTSGYGLFSIRRKNLTASRVAWEINNAPLLPGHHVLHRCDTPSCVNPSHLFLGDFAINNADRDDKGRQVTLRGEFNGHAKLTASDVSRIRNGIDRADLIAAELGVSVGHIRAIRRMDCWSYGERQRGRKRKPRAQLGAAE